MRRSRLPIHEPCTQDFAAMPGTDARRFCDRCSTHVHDLSSMTEREAQALLARSAGQQLCVRYHSLADGRIAFRPEPRAAALVVSLAMVACTGYADPEMLEVPDQAQVCRDASGDLIDCALAEEGVVPDEDAMLPVVETGRAGGVEGGSVGATLGGITVPVGEFEGEPAQACPLPHERRDDPSSMARADDTSRVMSRRERRRARREARRARRRGRQGTLMGRLIE